MKLALLDNQDIWVHKLHGIYFVCFLPKENLYFYCKLFGIQNLGDGRSSVNLCLKKKKEKEKKVCFHQVGHVYPVRNRWIDDLYDA